VRLTTLLSGESSGGVFAATSATRQKLPRHEQTADALGSDLAADAFGVDEVMAPGPTAM
jgi:hypothetical protein